MKVRNPWKQIGDASYKGSSHGDWTGRFSNDDSSWNDDLKAKSSFAELETGEFFMTIEDFKQGFKYYTITYLKDQWKTSFLEKRSSVNRRLYKFNFTITEDDFTTVPVNKKKKLIEMPADQSNLLMSEEQLLEQSEAQINELAIEDDMDLMLDYDLKEDEDSDWSPGTNQYA